MTRQQVADKKEKSLGEIVVIVVLIALLMVSFMHYFFKQEQVMVEAGFDRVANTFTTRVNAMHAQWFMDNQPRYIQLSIGKNRFEQVYINKQGWVDSQSTNNGCLTIWQQVMDSPMEFMQSPISAIEIRAIQHQGRHCQYSLPSAQFFEYDSFKGKVSKVQIRQ